MRFRPTHATIDLNALAHNYAVLKSLLPKEVEILGMVKADAYGHGAIPISKKLVECGVTALGVATVEEGLELRNAGITIPILVMGGLMGMGEVAAIETVKSSLTPVIHSRDTISILEEAARAAGIRIPIHLKVDTGMSRLGVRPESLPSLLRQLSTCKNIVIEGVMTHLADAANKEHTSYQMRIFLDAKREIEKTLGEIKIWHFGNSAAITSDISIKKLNAKKIWARPGIALYGSTDGLKLPKGVSLKPVMGLKSRIALLKNVPEGTKISYGCKFTTKRASRLGIIPIGYADGYRFNFEGRAKILVRGKRVPVIGRITMDMIIADLTNIKGVAVGEDVVLLGAEGDKIISADEMARWADTISYEIFCGISKRIPRVYINGTGH